MIDDDQLKAFAQQLRDQKSDLETLLVESHASRSAVQLDQTSVGRLSRMDAMQAQQLALAAGRKRELALSSIESALQRMRDGDFGYCMICDDEIGLKRLKFDPSLPTCVVCADKNNK